MECCFCQTTIEVKPSGWDKGHNAEPVKTNGRCCSDCNHSIVIPFRMGVRSFGSINAMLSQHKIDNE